MRKLLSILAVAALAGCGANYSPGGDLPGAGGSSGVVTPEPTSPVGVCATCAKDADCGPSSFCVPESDSTQSFCTAPCASDGTCDTGQTCVTINDANNNPLGSGCFPSNYSCLNPPVVTTGNGGTTSGTTTSGTTTSGSTSTSGTTTSGSTTGTGTTTSGTTTTSGSTSSTSTSTSTSGTTGNTCTPDTWSNWGSSWFQNNCGGCHYSGGNSPNLTSHTSVKNNSSQIKYQVDHGYMPQGRSLSQSDITRLDTYLNCGAP